MLDVDTLIESEGLFQTILPNRMRLTWRLLTIKEFRAFRALASSGVVNTYHLHDQVFDRCYLGQASLINGEIPVGWCLSIGRVIYEMSGGNGDFKGELDHIRMMNPADAIEPYMKRIVLRAFPSYTFEEIESWTRPVFLQRFVIAEQILAENGTGYEPLALKDILTPAEKARHDKKQKRSQGIDFARENASLNQATNTVGGQDIWDLTPDKFAKQRKIAEHMNKARR